MKLKLKRGGAAPGKGGGKGDRPQAPASKSAAGTGPAAPATSLRAIALGVALVALAAISAAAAAGYLQVRLALEAREREAAQAAARLFAGRVADLVTGVARTMALVAKDPALARLMEEGDEKARRARAAELGFLFPGNVRVLLLPPGVAETDETVSPPLGFACVDLVRQAETSDRPPPAEVHVFGTPNQHVDLVHPVLSPSGRRIVGHLLVSLPVGAVQARVRELPVQDGRVELRQLAGGRALAIASAGAQAPGTQAVVMPVPGTRWRLHYAPPPVLAGPGAWAVYWGAMGAAAVLALVAAALGLRRARAALEADAAALVGVVRELARGRAPQEPVRARLAECAGTLEVVADTAREAASAARAEARPPSVTATPGEGPTPGEVEAPLDFDLLAEGEEGAAETFPELDEEDEEEQAAEPGAVPAPEPGPPAEPPSFPVPAHVFRAYDIRGVVGRELTPELVQAIGRAIGSQAYELGEQTVVVGRDGRLSSPELARQLIEGLRESGRDVIDIGAVPTPVLYFATHYLDAASGVMVTGSHNPPDYNGFKIVLQGRTLAEDEIQALHRRIVEGRYTSGSGGLEQVDVVADYIERITSDVRVSRRLTVVVDCGNGIAGAVAPQLYRALGCDVIELYCEVDGQFPNHHPDPSMPENLLALTRAVQEHAADIGLAFDGDGDRLGVVASGGTVVWPDKVLMLLAMDVLSRNPGATVIYDVKSSRHLERVITDHGGQPVMWKTGHSLIKAKMQETGALLAGELSGHIFFRERWFGFDDALYAGARLLEVLSLDHRTTARIFGSLPESVATPELRVEVPEGEQRRIMERLAAGAKFPGARLTTVDGVRADFEDGWGLVRASNTTPCLILRFEADDPEALRRIQELFRQELLRIEPSLELPF